MPGIMKSAILLPIRRLSLALLAASVSSLCAAPSLSSTLEQTGVRRGIVAVIEPAAGDTQPLIASARKSEATFYVQTADCAQADALRKAAEAAGLLGQRLFIDYGSPKAVYLGDNLADAVISPGGHTSDAELLRVLRPRATAFTGGRKLVKPVPAGVDDWSHPYHGPDNNPQSQDQLARGNLQTQFLGFPMFSPMPQQSVAAGGRIFKAFGHIAHKTNQNEVLNTLMGVNAYNGTILWRRPLPAGFMIHRNTMVATEDALYLGDHESCKVFDGQTGEVRDQIIAPGDITDGPVWKWMAIRDGVLYALVGNTESLVATQKSDRRGLGHWPWGMWEGHDYKNPQTAFGFGRTVVAIDLKSRKVRWHHRDQGFLDARGVCMNRDRIFCYSPERFLLCLDRKTGKVLWKNSDPELLEAIGPNERAQHYLTGYATSCYIKCDQDRVFFAGPQRKLLVAASTVDGRLSWTHAPGNLQLVLRPEALYAAGPQGTNSYKLDYRNGSEIAILPGRRACTRATGGADSIFFRASGGTVRVLTATDTAQHIAPMRPSCQDGVIISNGHLYWSPWMCGCQLSLYGNICLGPANAAARHTKAADIYADALQTLASADRVRPLKASSADWPSYRANSARSDVASAAIPDRVSLRWQVEASPRSLPTAPVVAGGLVFVADRSGAVRAFDQKGKSAWKSYTGGPVYYPPAIAHNRAYVGCADGCVYAFEAATGRLLWTFRVGPAKQRIPVYGQLISRWPVSGGVVVQDDTVYAAAGIAHYDGTYVVALDVKSGKLRASNTTSGVMSPEVNSGISLQGELQITDGELRFLGGGIYEVARYDLATLKCLNEPKVQITSQYHTAFYPYFPDYGKYVSLDYACADGCTLTHDASYEGSRFTNLALEKPLPDGAIKPQKDQARWTALLRNSKPRPMVWQDPGNRRFTSFIVSTGRLLAAGHPEAKPEAAFLAAVNLSDGSDLWSQPLPAVPVKGGTALDHEGHIYAALENGQLVCFAP